MIADLPGLAPAQHDKRSIANILSLATARKICWVTMETLEEATVIVHKRNGNQMRFMESKSVLCCCDASLQKKSANCSFINSIISANKCLCTPATESADLAKLV